MNAIHHLHDEIAVVGWSCRLPGANSIADLWSLLLEGRCAVSQVPSDRFSLQRFSHPRRHERGRSYTWAAGILDDIFGFDPAVFGISPREAEQMDPQQRILLQLTWEALEDAGIRPSTIAGKDVGVFVGGSLTEYAYAISGDPAIADTHFGTGNALSILANRISYVFDLRGPSFTVDTACSSSLVALHQAAEALRSGRIDTAIVGGINIIASPCAFIGFSQASMLSPTGRCRAFSADADGFVRAEGSVVLVLRKASLAQANQNPLHGIILASDVNSDGRTNGISLPSVEAQEALLKRVYSRAGISANRLAFVEAHGTGTPAGDPIEAAAIGRSLGYDRSQPLPIGSIKTNIGHLEAASGIAGVVKALLSLNHGVLPPSLHFAEPNPNIDFERLKLSVCDKSLLLAQAGQRCAGVNSFGFGGTNAHVVVAAGRKPQEKPGQESGGGSFFALSAETKPALRALAQSYVERVSGLSDAATATLASAVAHRRDRLSHRIVISSTDTDNVIQSLDAFIAGTNDDRLTDGEAVGDDLPIAFVYSGNGSQWAGMGVAAYRNNAAFRCQFEQVDAYFKELAGWSLKDALFSEALDDRLSLTSVAQPLIFAIQSAATAALLERGIKPAAVFGHSVGEVAAAEAAGILDLRNAVKVIHFRSTHQEEVRGEGRMAALLATPEIFEELRKSAPKIELAAINSPRAITIAGPVEDLARFAQHAKKHGVAFLDLDLDYPFHTAAMAPIEKDLVADLDGIVSREGDVPFISAVTGSCLPGRRLDARYWWRNIRESVRFQQSVQEASKLGARFFIEVGPRSMLLKHVTDSLDEHAGHFDTLATLERNDGDRDPFEKVLAKALVRGAQVDTATLFGPDPGGSISLPSYPWQQEKFRWAQTPEALGIFDGELHPLGGTRYSGDALEWRAYIDTAVFPELADHKVGDQVILPGTGFLEIALIVARQWLQTEHIAIADFEILKPLDLTAGETREVVTRVSPASNSFEILSRPRLSQAGWLLNCRGKMLHGSDRNEAKTPARPTGGKTADGDAIYDLASSSGLHYGPAFRLARIATMNKDKLIAVELAPSAANEAFLLDPVRLDCCIHGFFLLFPELHTEERGVTYIPVRLDQVTLIAPRRPPQRAVIEVLSKNERSLLTNLFIYDADDNVIATLLGVRCQAVPVRRNTALEATAFIELPEIADGALLGETGVDARPSDIIAAARAAGFVDPDAGRSSDSVLMLEGWATALAYEIASALADRKRLDLDLLVSSNRLPDSSRGWLADILRQLSAAGLAREDNGQWTLSGDTTLPDSDALVKALAAEHPERAPELLIAGEISGIAAQIASERAVPASQISAVTQDFDEVANAWSGHAAGILTRLIGSTKKVWPKDRALRVLQVGHGPLTQSLFAVFRGRDVQHTLFEPNTRRFERAQTSLPRNARVTLLGPQSELPTGGYDLIVTAEGLSRLPEELPLAQLRQALAPRGLLAAIEPDRSLFRALVLGLRGGASSFAVPDAAHWQAAAAAAAGFEHPQAVALRCGQDTGVLIAASAEKTGAHHVALVAASDVKHVRSAWIVDGAGQRSIALANGLSRQLAARGVSAATDLDSNAPSNLLDAAPEFAVRLVSSDDGGDPVQQLGDCAMEIKRFAEQLASTKATLWFVFFGALATGASDVRPVQTGAWAFSRTLANEFPQLDIRRVDITGDVSEDNAAEKLAHILLSGTAETELQVGAETIRAVRVETIRPALDRVKTPPPAAASLQRRLAVGQRLFWQPNARRKPEATEIEIAVEATGLNFRDLMWMLALLPDDILEDGFTGPTLGLECAGRVLRTGSAIRNFKAGDRVLGFAPSAFATHLTVPAAQVSKIPDAMTYEGAATIPVAFVTAYYSLVTLAKLKRGEWVLIHAGAGGVGMAAIQIAKSRGAKIIATAGSRAKRDLLSALGVPHVLNSRSVNFADEVRKITGAGVDVVLNSLAGEAMERSVSCLRPFGRFVELGKRDYVSNTHLGLRPFRKNLSYFGVDIDQLIAGQEKTGRKVFAELMRQFENGTLTPLPHCVFPASDVSEAFHLMQQSGHIGKIVVRPPDLGAVPNVHAPLTIDPRRTHLITGAFGGFGLEAAKWLVKRGARHLVLVGRRGPSGEDAKAALADFERQGVKVLAEACDVADARAVEYLFEKIRHNMPPLAGVLHAAMVLDDAIIANLDSDRLQNVLKPKVKGAENLDLATRGTTLDYFVLFSSVTTLIGNPGQGAYVAANAYMEGLARRRRQKGLPALAVGWGPISDVGVVARSRMLQANLQKVGGAKGMTAREALDLMAQALEQPADAADLAVMTIAHAEGLAFGADRLPVLRSPTYAAFIRRNAGLTEGVADKIDLRALLNSEDEEVVQRKVTNVIVTQLARVLRFREEDISRVRPLGEMGLDSLMALELAMNLEETFGIQLTLVGGAGDLTVAKLADGIIAQAEAGETHGAESVAGALAIRHGDQVDDAQIVALEQVLEKAARGRGRDT